jgi:hypothetical protein
MGQTAATENNKFAILGWEHILCTWICGAQVHILRPRLFSFN